MHTLLVDIGCIESECRDRDVDQDGSLKVLVTVRKVQQDFGNRCNVLCPLPDRVRVPFMEDPKTGLVNSFLLDAIRKHLCSTSKRSPIFPPELELINLGMASDMPFPSMQPGIFSETRLKMAENG